MTKNLSDKSCQTFSIDWNNVQAKCPCCHNHVKVDLDYGPDSAKITLVPASTRIESSQVTSTRIGSSQVTNARIESSQATNARIESSQVTNARIESSQVASVGNSSLMNIVSVQSVGERHGRTFAPYSNNNHHSTHDDDSEMNESTSSSVSNSSMNRVIEPEVQITTLPDFTPSRSLRPSSDSSLRPSSYSSLRPSSDSSFSKNDSSFSKNDSSFSKNDSSSGLTSSAFNHFPNQGIRLKCQFHGEFFSSSWFFLVLGSSSWFFPLSVIQ